jgi:hypothetical protein
LSQTPKTKPLLLIGAAHLPDGDPEENLFGLYVLKEKETEVYISNPRQKLSAEIININN